MILVFLNVGVFMIGRSAYLTLITSYALIFFHAAKEKFRYHIYLVILALPIFLYAFSKKFVDRLHTSIDILKNFSMHDNATVVGDRLDFLRNSVIMINNNFIFGSGIGSWREQYIHYGGLEVNPPNNPHNQYLLWFTEGGVIGFTFLVLFLYCLYLDGRKLLPNEQNLFKNVLAQILLLGISTCIFFGAGIAEYFILVLACILCLNLEKSEI
jgi:O-antigen ligase